MLLALAWISVVGFPVFVAIAWYFSRDAVPPTAVVRVAPTTSTGVTLFKPCAGLDDDLEASLTSYFTVRHTPVQILFGVESPDDPALPIIERVRARHPTRDTTVVITGAPTLPSPKVSNLLGMAPHARYGTWWITDSNTRVHPDTLADLLERLAPPEVGCAASPVVGDGEGTLGSALENLHLGAFAGMGTYVAHALTGYVGTGKSVLVSRDTIASLGGLERLGAFAGDDMALFRGVRAQGRSIAQGRHVVVNVSARSSVRAHLRRHLRWMQIRWRTVPIAALWEPMLSPLIPTTVHALVTHRGFVLVFVALVEQLVADAWFVRRLRGRALPWRYVPLIPLRPWILLGLWGVAAVWNRVTWRGRTVRITWGSRMRLEPLLRTPPVHPTDTWSADPGGSSASDRPSAPSPS